MVIDPRYKSYFKLVPTPVGLTYKFHQSGETLDWLQTSLQPNKTRE